MNAFDLAAGRAWALSEDDLLTVMTIAARAGEGPETVAAQLGRPLANDRVATRQDVIAVIPLDGPMFRRANMLTQVSGATSTEQFAQDFRSAADDPGIKGIVLDISSPGGEVAGTNEAADMVFAARGAKPIVAYVGHQAASGAYWVASAADRIVMDATATVGSIGVVGRYMKQADKPGVTRVDIVSSQSPAKRLSPETEAGRAAMQREVDAIAQVFIEAVARNRGVSAENVLAQFGQGGVEVGAAAVRLGMADAIGSLDGVIKELQVSGAAGRQPLRRAIMASNQGPAAEFEPLNAAMLAAMYPEAAEALRAEGRAAAAAGHSQALEAARTEASIAERQRLVDIEAAALPGHEALRDKAIESGQSAPAFALAQALAEKAKGTAHLAALKNDEAAVAALKPAALPATATIDPNLPLDDRCKAEWDAKPALRAEFADNFGSYLAFAKAEAQGRVRRLVSKG